jgi:hypothetical protein
MQVFAACHAGMTPTCRRQAQMPYADKTKVIDFMVH